MHISYLFFLISDYINYPKRNYKHFEGVVREKNLVFDDRFGHFTKADAYYNPEKKSGKYPVFINFHGGGFVRGDKKLRKSFCEQVATEGYFVLNANYRLAGPYSYPSCLEDGINTLIYLEKIAEKYDLDLNKVVLSGDSAGAYNAAILTAYQTNPALRERFSFKSSTVAPAGFAGFCGPYDMEKMLARKSPLNVALDIANCFLGMKLNEDFSNISDFPYRNELSPVDFVTSAWPNSFLVMAKNDLFCGGQGEVLEQKLLENGVPVRCYKGVDKEFHCFHLDLFRKETKSCNEQFFAYLKDVKNK